METLKFFNDVLDAKGIKMTLFKKIDQVDPY